MAWIELRGKRVYVMDKVKGKSVCIPCGTDKQLAIKMVDEINQRKSKGNAEKAKKKMRSIYKEGK